MRHAFALLMAALAAAAEAQTDLEFTATVRHCAVAPIGVPCGGKVYRSTPGVNQNIIDTDFTGL